MNNRTFSRSFRWLWPVLALVAWPVVGMAQVAVPEIEEIEELPTISASEIEALVGPIALYPDDLLAIVLPASTFPLQIVEAARFLEAFEIDSSLEPDEDWDDSIVALLNYPDVVELLNEDLDWTWRMGEAVVAQQSDVIASIESFRDRAYAAGNLESDDYQLVSQEEGTIQITPVQDDVIYVPYYEPEQVVVYQPRPVYFYHPRPYPVYYYPYPSYYAFDNHFHHSFFWGVTTAFSIGWNSYHLNTYHHSFYGHPYYGHSYRDNWWYRRPDIHIYNNTYVRNDINANYDRYGQGDRWQPSVRRTLRASDQRVTRTRYYPNSNSSPTGNSNAFTGASTNSAGQVTRSSGSVRQDKNEMRRDEPEPVQFRDRPQTSGAARSNTNTARTPVARNQRTQQPSSAFRAEREPTPRAAPERKQQPRMAAKSQSQPRATTKRQSQPRQSQAQPRQSQSNSSSSNSSRSSQSSRSSEPRNSKSRSSNSRSSKSRSSNSRSSNSRSSKSGSSERER
jgi:hypothetical protein